MTFDTVQGDLRQGTLFPISPLKSQWIFETSSRSVSNWSAGRRSGGGTRPEGVLPVHHGEVWVLPRDGLDGPSTSPCLDPTCGRRPCVLETPSTGRGPTESRYRGEVRRNRWKRRLGESKDVPETLSLCCLFLFVATSTFDN